MPLLKLQTSASVPAEKREELLAAISQILATSIGKPERYVMVTIEEGAVMMAGQAGDAAFADVRSIGGLDGSANGQISQKLCTLLNDSLGIPADRVYINFMNVAAGNWGWNNSTFG